MDEQASGLPDCQHERQLLRVPLHRLNRRLPSLRRSFLGGFSGGAGNRIPRRAGESTGIHGNGGEPTGTEEGSISRRFPPVDAEHDARHTIDAAREYLSAGARGDECGHLAMKLASAVLSREDVRLAFEVMAGGPFCHARATELASRVLGRADVAVKQVTERVRGGA